MGTDQFGSGGGFSFMNFSAADYAYQTAAVEAFLASQTAAELPLPNSYNPKGRATPDVCALGEGYQVVMGASVQTVGGTSASAPAFSSMVSLLNDARIRAGKPAMGFLNPWIYKNPAAFTDVTAGDDRWGRGPFRIMYGFNATKGWDPVSGVGSPDFPKMLQASSQA